MADQSSKRGGGASRPAFLGRLRFPLVFVLLAILSVVNVVVPDPLPFVDEAVLGLLTLVTGMLRKRRSPPEKPPEKNVTPPGAHG